MGDTVHRREDRDDRAGPRHARGRFRVRLQRAHASCPSPTGRCSCRCEASITPDRLAADDERFLAVPVVAALPVVFVDQYGAGAGRRRSRAGWARRGTCESCSRRRPAAAMPRGSSSSVRHITPAELTQEVLADARLVVDRRHSRSAATWSPLLRDYVQQGGQLVIAAGAEFDPAAWNDAAWLDGAGILPLPLAREPLGEVPEVAGENLKPFHPVVREPGGRRLFPARRRRPRPSCATSMPSRSSSKRSTSMRRRNARRLRAAEMKRLEEELTLVAAVEAARTSWQPSRPRRVAESERQQLRTTKRGCASCGRSG